MEGDRKSHKHVFDTENVVREKKVIEEVKKQKKVKAARQAQRGVETTRGEGAGPISVALSTFSFH